jgi:hypothetical protein
MLDVLMKKYGHAAKLPLARAHFRLLKRSHDITNARRAEMARALVDWK